MRLGSSGRSGGSRTDGSRRERRAPWLILGRSLRLLAGGLAIGAIAIQALSLARLIDWQRLGDGVGPPWNSLLNPHLAPKTALLVAGGGALFLSLWATALFLGRPVVRSLLGEGTIALFRRLILFGGWLPVAAAGYLLLWVSPTTLRVDLGVHGDVASLTLPTLGAALVFGLATLTLPPKPKKGYLPRPLGWMAGLAFLPAVVGVVLSLEETAAGAQFRGGPLAQLLATQLALLGAESVYILTAVEGFLADWTDFRGLQPRGILRAGLALARAGARLAIFLAPVVLGCWLAVGAALPTASVLLDRNGRFLQFYHPAGEYRIHTTADEISPWMKKAIDAIEDPGVYTSPHIHVPINPVRAVGVFTTAVRSVQDRDSGRLSGGSGIPAQGCKNYYGRDLVSVVRGLPQEVPFRGALIMAATVIHKLAFEFECGWAFERASQLLGPDRSPVTFYLNAAYFGHGTYGVQAAALTYLGRPARDLGPADAALLAGLLQAPSYFDPWQRPDEVKARRGEVLSAMAREGYISEGDAAVLDAEPLGVLPEPFDPNPRSQGLVQYTRYLMDWLDARGFRDLSSSGLVVTTSLDPERQRGLEEQVRAAVERLRSRRVNNGAAVVLDAHTGAVLAWFGGLQPLYGPDALPDMVAAVPHQPGSTIKPLLYACALEEGQLRPDERLDDTPRVIGGRYIANWDLDPVGRGIRPAGEELAESRNVAAAELVDRLSPEGFAQCLRERFRVHTDLHPEQHGVELGLGLAEMPMLELAGAYTVLANGGEYVEPTPVLRIQGRDGGELYRNQPPRDAGAVSDETSRWVAEALSAVSARLGIAEEVATKTGTTPSSSYVVGYSSEIVLACWLGRTEPGRGPMEIDNVEGREGAGPIWRDQSARRDSDH